MRRCVPLLSLSLTHVFSQTCRRLTLHVLVAQMELDAFLSMCANEDLKALLKEGKIPLRGPYDGEDGDIKYTKKAHYIYALMQSGWGREFVSNTGVNVKAAKDALNDRLIDLPINAQSEHLIGVDLSLIHI